jgi:hypothetical protein
VLAILHNSSPQAFFPISGFLYKYKKYWWHIKIIKFNLVVRQRTSLRTPSKGKQALSFLLQIPYFLVMATKIEPEPC